MIGWGSYVRSILSGFRSPLALRPLLIVDRLLGDDLVITQQKAPAGAGASVGRQRSP